ncbi:MAG: hypothetical protein R6X34_30745, partial [Chloroflexota bacterium]
MLEMVGKFVRIRSDVIYVQWLQKPIMPDDAPQKELVSLMVSNPDATNYGLAIHAKRHRGCRGQFRICEAVMSAICCWKQPITACPSTILPGVVVLGQGDTMNGRVLLMNDYKCLEMRPQGTRVTLRCPLHPDPSRK